MILSILIPSLPHEESFLIDLISNLDLQKTDDVEIIIDKSGREITTGEKRNNLLSKATGEYSWFIDCDDEIAQNSINLILNALKSKPDVIGINGWMTTDNSNRVEWEMKLGNPYCSTIRNGSEFYLRFPNHISVMKTEIAKSVKFKHVTIGEDYLWAKEINDMRLLKTEVIIPELIYHYKFRSHK